MADSERRTRGLEKLREVYGGAVPAPPEGTTPFFDLMVEHLFGEVWTRPALSQRDRRLLVMGAIAALGERDVFALQVRSALANGELTAEQCREVVVQLAPYAGYPRVSGLVGVVEAALRESTPT